MTNTETGSVKPAAEPVDKQTFADRSDTSDTPAPTVDIVALIRSLQRADGHSPCFRGGRNDCDSPRCPWRQYCL